MSATSIDEALRQIRRGKVQAYRDIISLCEAKVRIVVSSIVPDLQMVEDLAQEAFFLAFRKLGEYRDGTDFVAWIKEIARNLALNERRAWIRRQGNLEGYRAHVEQLLEQDLLTQGASNEPDVLTAVRDCVSRLEGAARHVLEKFYWRGLSCSQIAEEHGRSTEWAGVTLHRTRAAIVRCLGLKGVLHG
ncbi:MAG: sigma-70 family RNA polymerase sigma factor [Acidobacteria bacterium]|nr:sigma-70 family RNA polymerase sigma factor [Acidobacteriota bacterium]